MRAAFALCAVALVGCASIPQTAEKTDTTALQLYGTIGRNIDAYEAAGGDKTKGEALRLQAFKALDAEHTAYRSGLVGDLTAIEALVAPSKNPGAT